MQVKFSAFTSTIAIVALCCVGNAVNALVVPSIQKVPRGELLDWISNTDANLTFVGNPFSTKRAGAETTVVYCNKQTQNVCGGDCTVYTGGATCLNAKGTACIRADSNVGFCDRGGCGGSCNQIASCGVRLDSDFCKTPGTASINVPFIV